MKLHSFIALAGGFLGVGASMPVMFVTQMSWISLGIVIGVGVVGYIFAAVSAARSPKFAEVCRGFLIGFNSGINGFLIFSILSAFLPLGVGVSAGMALGALNFLCVLEWLTQSSFYQGVMGWVNWVLPMSWPIVGVGILFFLFSLLLSCLTGFQVRYLRLQGGKVDWPTGTFFIKGGLVANLNVWDTAFNMGNFSFVDMNSRNFHVKHEAGHSLNLGAFGWVFHLIGFLEEFVFQRGAKAYSERIAESHDTGRQGSNIPMWA